METRCQRCDDPGQVYLRKTSIMGSCEICNQRTSHPSKKLCPGCSNRISQCEICRQPLTVKN